MDGLLNWNQAQSRIKHRQESKEIELFMSRHTNGLSEEGNYFADDSIGVIKLNGKFIGIKCSKETFNGVSSLNPAQLLSVLYDPTNGSNSTGFSWASVVNSAEKDISSNNQ